MERLSREWKRLEVTGKHKNIHLLVNVDTGHFGTMLDNDPMVIQSWDSLPQARAWIKEFDDADAVNAVEAETMFRDEFPKLKPLRARKTTYGWARVDGRTIHSINNFYLPDPDVDAALAQKQIEYQAAKEEVKRIREEAVTLIRGLTPLSAAGGDNGQEA